MDIDQQLTILTPDNPSTSANYSHAFKVFPLLRLRQDSLYHYFLHRAKGFWTYSPKSCPSHSDKPCQHWRSLTASHQVLHAVIQWKLVLLRLQGKQATAIESQ